jgi:hypothetical protein
MTIPSGKMQNNLPLPYDFEINTLLKGGWERVSGIKATYWKAILIYVASSFLVGLILSGIAGLILYAMHGSVTGHEPLFRMVINLSVLILFPIFIGIFYIGILRAIDQPTQTTVIFEPYQRKFHIWGSLLLSSLCLTVLLFVGFIFCGLFMSLAASLGSIFLYFLAITIGVITVTASMYLSLGFMFAPILVFEKKMGIIAAMKASLYGFSKHWFKISLLQSILVIIMFISAIPLFLGYIWSVPFGFNVSGSLYNAIFGVEKSF